MKNSIKGEINIIKLTIIIPHYNSPKSLKALLNTIPNSEEIQIIVVDDKSDQNDNELMYKMKNKNITYLINKTNKKGAGVCRNLGLKKALGEWVLFADADDFFLKEFYNCVNKYFDSNYEVIFFRPTSVEVDTGKVSNRHIAYENLILNYLEEKNVKTESRLRYRFFAPWSKLIRKSFLEKNEIEFDEVIASNDVMFSTKIGLYMENFLVSKEAIYCITKNKGTLTTNINEKNFNSRLKVLIDYIHFLEKNLSNTERKFHNLNGSEMIIRSIRYRFKLKKTWSIYRELRKNKINIIDRRVLNPHFLTVKLYKWWKNIKKNKKYLSG